jgi:hypothetical protein
LDWVLKLHSCVAKGLVSGDLNALPRVGGDEGTELFGTAAREVNDGAGAFPTVIAAGGGTFKVQPAH